MFYLVSCSPSLSSFLFHPLLFFPFLSPTSNPFHLPPLHFFPSISPPSSSLFPPPSPPSPLFNPLLSLLPLLLLLLPSSTLSSFPSFSPLQPSPPSPPSPPFPPSPLFNPLPTLFQALTSVYSSAVLLFSHTTYTATAMNTPLRTTPQEHASSTTRRTFDGSERLSYTSGCCSYILVIRNKLYMV